MLGVPIAKTHDPFDSRRILTIQADAGRKHMAIFAKSGVAGQRRAKLCVS
jgi:hypothetical protein